MASVSRWWPGSSDGMVTIQNPSSGWSELVPGVELCKFANFDSYCCVEYRCTVQCVQLSSSLSLLCPVIITLCQSGLRWARAHNSHRPVSGEDQVFWHPVSQSVLPDMWPPPAHPVQLSSADHCPALTYIFTFFYWLDVHQLSAASVCQAQWPVTEIQELYLPTDTVCIILTNW